MVLLGPNQVATSKFPPLEELPFEIRSGVVFAWETWHVHVYLPEQGAVTTVCGTELGSVQGSIVDALSACVEVIFLPKVSSWDGLQHVAKNMGFGL